MGIKTGITPSAGPCLASYFRVKLADIIVVTLCSSSLHSRYSDTRILLGRVSEEMEARRKQLPESRKPLRAVTSLVERSQ